MSSETGRRQAAEESPQGTAFAPPVGAFDEDFNDTISFSIQGSDHGLFAIDTSTGMLSASSQLPSLATSTEYQITVRISDSTGLFLDASVTVTVADVNNGPVYTNLASLRTVSENAVAGTAVSGPAVSATDADGNDVVFTIFSGPIDSRTGQPIFDIGSTSGSITVRGPISFETHSSFTLTIAATDRPDDLSTAITTHGQVIIEVLDVPEAPRVVGHVDLRESSVSLSASRGIIVRVGENSPRSTVLAVGASDRPIWYDEDLASTNVTFSIVSVAPATVAPAGLWGGVSGGSAAATALAASLEVRGAGSVTPPAGDIVRPSRYHRMEFYLSSSAAPGLLNFE